MPLVNTTEMFKKAYEGGYAIGAFNVNNMEIVQGITSACQELKAPVILQVSAGARKYANRTYLIKLVEAAVIECPDIPIALHLDHGPSFDLCKACIDDGFTSVMFDGSSKPYEENVEEASRVVEYAHKYGVTVEAELGQLAGVEDDVKVADDKAQFTDPNQVQDFVTRTGVDSLAIAIGTSHVSAEHSVYTDPDQAVEFVQRSGCDSLAVAIGTSHGAYKFKPGQKPKLRLDILQEVSDRLPGFPIVLHGASSVPQEFVKQINENGGQMPDAIGIPEEMLREAAKMAVCKINIDSDLRLAMTASVRKYLAENPSHFDPRQYLAPARDAIKTMVEHKINTVLGCAGKA